LVLRGVLGAHILDSTAETGSILVDHFHQAKWDQHRAPEGIPDVSFTYISPLYVVETELGRILETIVTRFECSKHAMTEINILN
jgi:hypothetical protein